MSSPIRNNYYVRYSMSSAVEIHFFVLLYLEFKIFNPEFKRYDENYGSPLDPDPDKTDIWIRCTNLSFPNGWKIYALYSLCLFFILVSFRLGCGVY